MTDDELKQRIAATTLHSRLLVIAGDLAQGDPATETERGQLLVQLAEAIEDYEKVVFPIAADASADPVMCAESGRPCTKGCTDACYWQTAAGVQASDHQTGDPITELIGERDHNERWANDLADAIGAHFGVDIGQHIPGANNPWATALELLRKARQ
jgi:hypothetical protein